MGSERQEGPHSYEIYVLKDQSGFTAMTDTAGSKARSREAIAESLGDDRADTAMMGSMRGGCTLDP